MSEETCALVRAAAASVFNVDKTPVLQFAIPVVLRVCMRFEDKLFKTPTPRLETTCVDKLATPLLFSAFSAFELKLLRDWAVSAFTWLLVKEDVVVEVSPAIVEVFNPPTPLVLST